MKTAKAIVLSVLPLLFYSCGNRELDMSKEAAHQAKIPADTLPAQSLPEVLGKKINIDQKLNPYLTQKEDTEIVSCHHSKANIQSIFQSMIKQFKTALPPIQIGPIPEPVYQNQKTLIDSVFISACLQDTAFYTEPAEDRTYGYYKGKLVGKTEKYVLCLLLSVSGNGFDYTLYSFTPTGSLIAKKEVGGLCADVYECYGFVNDKSFETYKNEFGHENGAIFIKNEVHEKYIIDEYGKFVKI